MSCTKACTLLTYCLCIAQLTDNAREEEHYTEENVFVTKLEKAGWTVEEALRCKDEMSKVAALRNTAPQIIALLKHLALIFTCQGVKAAGPKFRILGAHLARSKFEEISKE